MTVIIKILLVNMVVGRRKKRGPYVSFSQYNFLFKASWRYVPKKCVDNRMIAYPPSQKYENHHLSTPYFLPPHPKLVKAASNSCVLRFRYKISTLCVKSCQIKFVYQVFIV